MKPRHHIPHREVKRQCSPWIPEVLCKIEQKGKISAISLRSEEEELPPSFKPDPEYTPPDFDAPTGYEPAREPNRPHGSARKGVTPTPHEEKKDLYYSKPYTPREFPTLTYRGALPPDVVEDAEFIRGAKILDDTGDMDKVRDYLKEKGISIKSIDTELSSRYGLVVEKTNGKLGVYFRGTNVDAVKDITKGQIPTTDKLKKLHEDAFDADLKLLQNSTDSKTFNESRDLLERVELKYGKVPDFLSGYSLGGAKAHLLGDEFGIKNVRTFNPFANVGTRVSSAMSETDHEVWRTTNDPVSVISDYELPKFVDDKWKVNRINPLGKTSNRLKAHDLNNFTDKGIRYDAESIHRNIYSLDAKRNELQVHRDYDDFKRDARRLGLDPDSFSDFWRYFNKSGDTPARKGGENVDMDGLPKRVKSSSLYPAMWEKRGEKFTSRETTKLEQNEGSEIFKPYEFHSTDEELARGTEEDVMRITEEHAKLTQFAADDSHIARLNHESILKDEGVVGKDHVRGYLEGMVGADVAERIDPKGKGVRKDYEIGAIAGALGGPEGVLVGVPTAVVAGATARGTGKLVKKAGGGETAQEATGSVVGGAAGGLTSAAVLAGIAEGSIALAPETAGLSILAGAAIGGGLYAAHATGIDKPIAKAVHSGVDAVVDVGQGTYKITKKGAEEVKNFFKRLF